MNAIPVLGVLFLLAACGGGGEEQPRRPLIDPVATPIQVGDELRDELRSQNDAAKARRQQIDKMAEQR